MLKTADETFTEHFVEQDLPPDYPASKLKPFARRSYLLSDGRKLRIVVNNFVKKFQLLLNKKVLMESVNFGEVDKKFKRIMRKDKRFFS